MTDKKEKVGFTTSIPDEYQDEHTVAVIAQVNAATRKMVAEAEAVEWDSRTSRIMSESADLAHTRDVERRAWDEASDLENRVFHFTDSVSTNSVSAAIDILSHWRRLDAGNERPYEVVLTSEGGSVVAGYKLYAYLLQVATERPLVTVASGLCASMATIIHQAGTDRVVEQGCSYLIHDPSGVAVGAVGNLTDTTNWINALKTKGHQILASKSSLTVEEVSEKCSRRDWWELDDRVVELGFADRVR
jgi:ATP-dependent protease ClpP protease subunit